MKNIDIHLLTDNFIQAIGKEWMLISAGDGQNYNMMTASWGGIGFLWNRPVVFAFVRPERYTYQFVEERDNFVLSFLGNEKKAREIYNLCGTKSGRDMDKMKGSDLTPVITEESEVVFKEARLTLVCKKLYTTNLQESGFIDQSLLPLWYEKRGGLHKVYVAEITKAYIQE